MITCIQNSSGRPSVDYTCEIESVCIYTHGVRTIEFVIKPEFRIVNVLWISTGRYVASFKKLIWRDFVVTSRVPFTKMDKWSHAL